MTRCVSGRLKPTIYIVQYSLFISRVLRIYRCARAPAWHTHTRSSPKARAHTLAAAYSLSAQAGPSPLIITQNLLCRAPRPPYLPSSPLPTRSCVAPLCVLLRGACVRSWRARNFPRSHRPACQERALPRLGPRARPLARLAPTRWAAAAANSLWPGESLCAKVTAALACEPPCALRVWHACNCTLTVGITRGPALLPGDREVPPPCLLLLPRRPSAVAPPASYHHPLNSTHPLPSTHRLPARTRPRPGARRQPH